MNSRHSACFLLAMVLIAFPCTGVSAQDRGPFRPVTQAMLEVPDPAD